MLTYTMGATSEAGTAYPFGAPEFTTDFKWGSCYSIFCFMCMFCGSLVVLLYYFFGRCVVCSSSMYGIWLPLWYLQTLLITLYLVSLVVISIDMFIDVFFYVFIFVLFIVFTYHCQKKPLHWLPASAPINIVITWCSVIYFFCHYVVCSSSIY